MTGNRVRILVLLLTLSLGAYWTDAIAAPIELTACDSNLVSGSYVLANNITTTESCFILMDNNITIDLNGFTITGSDDSPDARAIWDGGVPRENIVIRNGTIRDFVLAVSIGESDNCTVEMITAVSNGGGIFVGDQCLVTHNITSNNLQAGIVTGRDSTVSYNISNKNNIGISLNLTNVGSSILYNTVNGNSFIGISLVCPSNVIGNIAQNNGTNFLQQVGTCKRYDNLF